MSDSEDDVPELVPIPPIVKIPVTIITGFLGRFWKNFNNTVPCTPILWVVELILCPPIMQVLVRRLC